MPVQTAPCSHQYASQVIPRSKGQEEGARIRGIPAAAAAASAAERARSRTRESAERGRDRSKQRGGMALRRVPMVKGGTAVGRRSVGSPVRVLGLLLLAEAREEEEEEEEEEGKEGFLSWAADGCEARRVVVPLDPSLSTVDDRRPISAATAARALRFETL